MPKSLTEKQKKLWLAYAKLEGREVGQVVNGVEDQESHKFENVLVIEPKAVSRDFQGSKGAEAAEKQYEKDDKMSKEPTWFQRWMGSKLK